MGDAQGKGSLLPEPEKPIEHILIPANELQLHPHLGHPSAGVPFHRLHEGPVSPWRIVKIGNGLYKLGWGQIADQILEGPKSMPGLEGLPGVPHHIVGPATL